MDKKKKKEIVESNIRQTINKLKDREKESKFKKYFSDANDSAFKRFVLEYLKEQIKIMTQISYDLTYLRIHSKTKKKEPSDYNLHIASEIASGKTFAEAIENWKKR